jgi:hypothetical protein
MTLCSVYRKLLAVSELAYEVLVLISDHFSPVPLSLRSLSSVLFNWPHAA